MEFRQLQTFMIIYYHRTDGKFLKSSGTFRLFPVRGDRTDPSIGKGTGYTPF